MTHSNPDPDDRAPLRLGVSGRIAAFFLTARITPLLALVALLLGIFAVMVTPREEEPQIDVTMANVIVPFPGASPKQVEQSVAGPAEQVFSRMPGVEHVVSVSRPGVAVLTVQFKVGVSRTEAIVRLHDTVAAHRDWLPPQLGVGEPIIRPKGIDDVPIVSLTLHGAAKANNEAPSAYDLERVAHAMEAELKRVPGTRDVSTLGGPGRAIRVELDAGRMRSSGVTVADLRGVLQSANLGLPLGETIAENQSVAIESGPFLSNADEVAGLVVAARHGRPVYLRDVARVSDGALPPARHVWFGQRSESGAPLETDAVTMTITKKSGENAVDVAQAVIARVAELRNTVVPADVEVSVTRNYGETANDKAKKLIQKLLFATASVVGLVFIALGRREAAIVGIAVALTLTATLFASWAWGFTLNRVSLFALIFSIGILVDDAIVVVENIHRHMLLKPGRPLLEIIPAAVDEVGGPTILATLTVIAALLPMAFVSGLMGPYMSPIPINASMGMLISLAIAFILTPWLSNRWLKVSAAPQHEGHGGGGLTAKLLPFFTTLFKPFLDKQKGHANRIKLWLGILGLIVLSVSLPVGQLVVLKMLPFDNKSEFQVVLDMPAGTPLERTASVLQAMSAELAKVPEVSDWQVYVGTAAPINFNGLVRQYDLRTGGEVGDIQVNLVDKHDRSAQSHAIAMRVRPALHKIAVASGGRVKVVEVPPGPPVMSPIVAEIYGPSDAARLAAARAVRGVFDATPGIVDVDSSDIATAPKQLLVVDREKAAMLGVPQAAIVSTLRASLAGEDVSYLHNQSKYPVPLHLSLPVSTQGDTSEMLKLSVRSSSGALVPIAELVRTVQTTQDQPIWHKDLLPVNMVVADMAGVPDAKTGVVQGLDSPLYGLAGMRPAIAKLEVAGGHIQEFFTTQPTDPYRAVSLKWDGESQITYETFRDMGAAYGVGLILIYLLVVAQFGSYRTPLIIMAPIPLTIIGVMPGHALLGAQFTATSMIGMIALAGIIVRNSILLVDFIELQVREGVAFGEAVIRSAATRAQPIALTGLAAMAGAFFILDDPIFNGLAISLIFGILVSTMLTLVVIPLLYFRTYRHEHGA
ncbi:efflux RND transporter permease subunit [Aquabacterium sp.]|uniref:efflux RND transporter permease subunit n=1 Tax=Aquabacterium sp. TaxID=1872578 RepID=UPI002486EF4A|nr:efflux RND transporter permease subunit [Aquabacterium sp.]MDI1261522.1 efflux RND transporter permease subunit [Aquabacterium sp.]